jgi:hypothetical protein
MFDEIYLSDQKKLLVEFLQKKYNIDITSTEYFNDFIDMNLGKLTSIKIWSEHLNDSHSFGAEQYLNEIISNLNQLLILAMLGFGIPSLMLIRRSSENLLMFLYFKDHHIEFIKRELSQDATKKEKNQEYRVDRNRISELKEYVENFPFTAIYPKIEKSKINDLSKNLIQLWDNQYGDLSNFVHGTSSRYLELKNYLDEINSDKESLDSISKYTINYYSLVNSYFILFYFNKYKDFETREKSIIRNAIDGETRFKQKLTELFGEI